MHGISAANVAVEAGDARVVGHVGLHTLAGFADRIGVAAALGPVVPWAGERAPAHDRGKVLTHAMVMLAGGGNCVADVEHLRVEDVLFGSVASDSTTYRVVRHELTSSVRADLHTAFATARRRVWSRSSATTGTGPVVLDIDASLVQIHSENKEGTAPNYKRGFGFHPMFCFADATGEALAAVLRPGNAAANNIADHLHVLDEAIGQLPVEIAAGHRRGDHRTQVTRPVVVRADSAGCTTGFLAGCHERNIGFAVVARRTASVSGAIMNTRATDPGWKPARTQQGKRRKGAAVIELTDRVDLSKFPEGTRLIVRREPRHPGAQTTLFDSENYRYWGHYTDQAGTPVELDTHMRAHAHVENHLARLKASGLERFPFKDLTANQAWLTIVCMAADLVRWFQLLCLTGPLATADPKTLRWTLWHTPARIIRRSRRTIIRLLDDWPSTHAILDAYQRTATLTT